MTNANPKLAKDNKGPYFQRVVLSVAALVVAASGCFWGTGREPHHEEHNEVRPSEHHEERREEHREEHHEEHHEDHHE